jgi:hypothetical protein
LIWFAWGEPLQWISKEILDMAEITPVGDKKHVDDINGLLKTIKGNAVGRIIVNAIIKSGIFGRCSHFTSTRFFAQVSAP